MSSTNKTTYYELPQYVESDIFNPMADDNDAFSKIDTALHDISEVASSAGGSVSGIESRLTTAETDIDGLETIVGDTPLNTSSQNVTDAINEIHSNVGLIDSDVTRIDSAVTNLQSDVYSINNSLNAEIVNRENDDNALSGRIIAEATARANADTSINTAIANEVTARTNADTAINEAISTEATNRANGDALLQNQIDEIVAPTGEAPNPAEIVNARIGYDNVTYTSLGDAIRTQIEDVYDEIDGITEPTRNIWKFDRSYNLNPSQMFGEQGVTLYPAGTYTISFMYDNMQNVLNYWVYNSSGTAGSGWVGAASDRKTITVTSATPIERIFFQVANSGSGNISDIQLEIGSTATDYAPTLSAVDYNFRTEANAKFDVIEPITEFTNHNIANTRNIWKFDTEIEVNSSIQLGTGTVLYPDNNYAISLECVSSDDQQVELFVYGGDDDRQLGYYYIHPADGRNTFFIDFNEPITRFFFRKTGATFTLKNIQFEVCDYEMYFTSPSPANLGKAPYATPYIGTKALKDANAREYESHWVGKTILYNGDSITQGSNGNSYVKYVNEMLRFGKMINYAIGGTRLAHVENEPNCLVDRISDMNVGADVIFIMANTNDYASQVPLGIANSTDPSTFNGALNNIISYLKTHYPASVIIISTMLTRKVNYEGGQPLPITIEQYAQCVRDRAIANHVILYDAYNLSGMDLETTPTDGTGFSDDHLHPNTNGHKALARKIAAFINQQ